MASGRIVAVGGALIDVKGTTRARWAPDRSLPGTARVNAGGAARNVAVNLARLGYQVTLLTAVGDDPFGDWVLRRTGDAGVDVSHAVRRPEQTGFYVTVGSEGGEAWHVADAGPLEALTPADLGAWDQVIRTAAVVIGDANLLEPAQSALSAHANGRPRVLLAASPDKAVRLRSVLAGAAVLVCNRAEALSLTGLPGTLGWQALGTALLVEGVERVVLTHAEGGVAVLTADAAEIAPAAPVSIVDATGAGDAVAAIAVHAYLAGLDAAQTAALAVAAAAIVVQSPEVTPSELARALQT